MTSTTYSTHPHTQHTPEHLGSLIRQDGDASIGKFGNAELHSAFQPIYSLAHRRAVGYEALLRPYRGRVALTPAAVYEQARDEREIILLDYLCRMLHLRNFRAQDNGGDWLFLNINPLAALHDKHHGDVLRGLLAHLRIPPHRVVIEILEGEISDTGALVGAVNYYKELGCLVALDDFGAGHSNFDRIWQVRPNIVKLDRSIVANASASRTVRRMIPNLVKLLHEAGSLVLMEGIESADEGLIAMDSDVDFAQGFYFARPSPALAGSGHGRQLIDDLHTRSAQACRTGASAQRQQLTNYLDAFEVLFKQVKDGVDAASACHNLLALPRTERCYMLDRHGRQLRESIVAEAGRSGDLRFSPVQDSKTAIWARRHYFRSALASPGEIQISQPYLSIAGGKLCITLSVALFHNKDIIVICADLTCQDG